MSGLSRSASSAVSMIGAGWPAAISTTLLYVASWTSGLRPTSRSGGTSANRISSVPSVCETIRRGLAASRTARPAPSVTVRGKPAAGAVVEAAGGASGVRA
jgi:hypothetical protein